MQGVVMEGILALVLIAIFVLFIIESWMQIESWQRQPVYRNSMTIGGEIWTPLIFVLIVRPKGLYIRNQLNENMVSAAARWWVDCLRLARRYWSQGYREKNRQRKRIVLTATVPGIFKERRSLLSAAIPWISRILLKKQCMEQQRTYYIVWSLNNILHPKGYIINITCIFTPKRV